MIRRFIVCDEGGALRSFFSKDDALAFMRDRPELELKVLPIEPKPNYLELLGECLL